MAKVSRNDAVDAALALKKAGWLPWPTQPGTSVPIRAGDDNRTWGGREHKPLTEAEIVRAWTPVNSNDPVPGMGSVVPVGRAVLDLDPKNDPAVTEMFGYLASITRCASTPHDGLHAYFEQPGGAAVQIVHGKGFDLLGHGSFVAMPSPTTKGREWTNPETPISANADVFAMAKEILTSHGIDFRVNEPMNFLSEDDRIIPDHARNNTLTALTGVLTKMGLARNFVRAIVHAIGSSPETIASPLDASEIDTIVNSITSRSSRPFDFNGLTFETITPQDDVKPLRWVIPDFVPDETVTMLYGLPAQGKSWIATLCAMVVASGGVFPLNDKQCAKGSVLYCDWERRGDMVKRRLKALTKLGLRIEYVGMKGSISQRIEDIRARVALKGHKLIICDSLTIALMGGDANSAGEVIPAMFGLQDICDELGCAILILDHQKKVYENENPWAQGAFGSIMKEAVATMQWQAGKVDHRAMTEGYMDIKLHLRKKNHEKTINDLVTRLTFTFNDEEEISHVEFTPLQELTLSSAIIDALGQREEMTAQQIASSGTASLATVRRELEKLLKANMIEVAQRGEGGRGGGTTYRLVESGTE